MTSELRIVPRSPYAGQRYWFVCKSSFPRWTEVSLVDENGRNANREIKDLELEAEQE